MIKNIVTLLLLVCFSLAAKEHTMLMQGKPGKPMFFEPTFLKIAPGDTVKFVSQMKGGGHNVQSFSQKASRPEGAKKWRSLINKDHVQKFEKPGFHLIKCNPHLAMGMVGAIQVGDDSSNLEAVKAFVAKKVRGKKAKATYEEIFSKLK